MLCKDSLLLCGCLHFLDSVFGRADVFTFVVVLFISLFFYGWYFWVAQGHTYFLLEIL